MKNTERPGHCGRCGYWATNDPILKGLTCTCSEGPAPAVPAEPIRANGKRKEKATKATK